MVGRFISPGSLAVNSRVARKESLFEKELRQNKVGIGSGWRKPLSSVSHVYEQIRRLTPSYAFCIVDRVFNAQDQTKTLI